MSDFLSLETSKLQIEYCINEEKKNLNHVNELRKKIEELHNEIWTIERNKYALQQKRLYYEHLNSIYNGFNVLTSYDSGGYTYELLDKELVKDICELIHSYDLKSIDIDSELPIPEKCMQERDGGYSRFVKYYYVYKNLHYPKDFPDGKKLPFLENKGEFLITVKKFQKIYNSGWCSCSKDHEEDDYFLVIKNINK